MTMTDFCISAFSFDILYSIFFIRYSWLDMRMLNNALISGLFIDFRRSLETRPGIRLEYNDLFMKVDLTL